MDMAGKAPLFHLSLDPSSAKVLTDPPGDQAFRPDSLAQALPGPLGQYAALQDHVSRQYPRQGIER